MYYSHRAHTHMHTHIYINNSHLNLLTNLDSKLIIIKFIKQKNR